jgi:high-affinity nickel-transport protein
VHGIGAETPTQLVILTTAAGAQGQGAGVAFLLAFVIGLIASNTTVASAMAVGRLDPERSFAVYATLSVVIAVFSIVAGTAFLLGAGTSLPVISGS